MVCPRAARRRPPAPHETHLDAFLFAICVLEAVQAARPKRGAASHPTLRVLAGARAPGGSISNRPRATFAIFTYYCN